MISIRESHGSAAKAYAEHLASELLRKPLDRHLLNRFAVLDKIGTSQSITVAA
jgi:hypothetical protein